MGRVRSVADVVPIAAVEPDGLLVHNDGTYVRLIECVAVLQPLRGGRAHREAIRAQFSQLAARLPAGQRIQVLVEAEPLEVDRELARDWQEIDVAAAAAARRGEGAAAGAMRRLGHGLEQTVRRSALAEHAVRLRFTVITAWRPPATSWTGWLRRRRRARVLERRAHERAAADSLRLSDTVAGELTGAGCDVVALDGSDALAALARTISHGGALDADALVGLPQVLDTTDADVALAHRQTLLGGGRCRRRVAGRARLAYARHR
jgi:hypothetical protein